MKPVQACAVLLLTALLGGCVLAPGQHFTRNGFLHNSDASRYFQVVPITPKLLAMDAAAAQQTRTPHVPQALLDYQPGPYRIGPGDTLYITVWEHPELTAPAGAQQQTSINSRLVRSDGTLYYPFVGVVHVAGMTLEQLRQLISRKLAPYIPNPQVDVGVTTYASRHVTLGGAFDNTTPLPVTSATLTLAQAIGAAKVNTAAANRSNLVLTRNGHAYHLNLEALAHDGNLAHRIYLRPGDQLYLPYNDHESVYVLGGVTAPQVIPFTSTALTLTQALGLARGINQTFSTGRRVLVIRGVKDLEKRQATVYELNAHNPVAFALADNFELQPGDVVYVGTAGVTRWNRLVTQLLPITAALNSAAAVQTANNR